MKNLSRFFVMLVLTPLLIVGVFCVSQNIKADNGGGGGGCGSSPTPGTIVPTSSSDTIMLSSGWNVVSTPKVLSNHKFSADETSVNFDILLLDPTTTSGWQTMQGEGQTEFQPLYAYFIDNKTGISQTLTFNYDLNLSPAQRLFQRTLKPGWNGVGIALPDSTIQWAHQNPYSGAVSTVLNQINSSVFSTIDFTANQSDPNSVGVSNQWNVRTSLGANDVNSLQNLKGYGAYVTQTTSLFMGYENLSETEYNLTYAAGANGSITGNASQTVYAGLNGTTVTAVPDTGYQFTGWSGTDCSMQNPRTDTGVASNVNVTANFSPITTTAEASLGANTVTNSTAYLGASQFTFWSAPLQVTTRTIELESANFRMIGSAPANALSNIKMFIDGVDTGATATLGAINGNTYAQFNFTGVNLNNAISLPTGIHTVEVRADVTGGSARTIQLSVQLSSDIILYDPQVNTNINVGGLPNSGGQMNIANSLPTVIVDPTFASQTIIAAGATNATIGRYIIHAYGEDIKVGSIQVLPALTGATPTATGLNNVTLYFNGSQVGSQQNWSGTGNMTFQLGSQMILPAGQDSTLEVRADLYANNAPYTAGTIAVTLPAETSNATGQSSQTTLGIPAADVSTSGLSIQSASLSIIENSAYADQTIAPNTTGVKIGSYVIQNQSSAEGIRLTSIKVKMVDANGIQLSSTSAPAITNFSSLRTSDTTGSGSTPIQPTGLDTFSINDVLQAGQQMTLDLFANAGSVATGSFKTEISVCLIGTVDNIATCTPSADVYLIGQTMTLGTGTLATPTLVISSTTPSQYISSGVSGATNATQAAYNFASTNGSSTITELKFTVIDSASNGSVTNICVGSTCAQPVSGTADLTGLSLAVPNGGGGLTIDALASYAPVGTSGLTPGTTSNIALSYYKYTSGGTTKTKQAPADFTAVSDKQITLVGSSPVVTINSSSNSGLILGATNKIGEVTFSANVTGSIKLNTITFNTGLSGFTSGSIASPFVSVSGTTPVPTITCAGSTTIVCATNPSSYANDFSVGAGQSQTFSLYATIGGTAQDGSTAAVSSSVTPAGFIWDDTSTNGTFGTGLDGNLIYGFPTASYVIHQ